MCRSPLGVKAATAPSAGEHSQKAVCWRIQRQNRPIGALREERLGVGVERHDRRAEAEAQRPSGDQQHAEGHVRGAHQ